jgi:hypothetical protein
MTLDSAPRLSDEELVEVLGLIRGADSVELKVTVAEEHHRSAIAALEMDPLDAQIRQVFFFDTPELALNQAGLVVRARRVQDKGDDSIVKLRPFDPRDAAERWRDAPEFGVEVDAMPGGFVCSGAIKHAHKRAPVRDAVAGRLPLSRLFSKAQRALFAEHAPAGTELEVLRVLGPIFVLKLKFAPRGYDRKLVAEFWLYPDYSAILELSTKCAPTEAFQVAAEARAFLTERGVDLSGEQQTKTRKALEFFSQRLREARANPSGG